MVLVGLDGVDIEVIRSFRRVIDPSSSDAAPSPITRPHRRSPARSPPPPRRRPLLDTSVETATPPRPTRRRGRRRARRAGESARRPGAPRRRGRCLGTHRPRPTAILPGRAAPGLSRVAGVTSPSVAAGASCSPLVLRVSAMVLSSSWDDESEGVSVPCPTEPRTGGARSAPRYPVSTVFSPAAAKATVGTPLSSTPRTSPSPNCSWWTRSPAANGDCEGALATGSILGAALSSSRSRSRSTTVIPGSTSEGSW